MDGTPPSDRGEPSRPGSDFWFDPLSAGLGLLLLLAVPVILQAILVSFGLPLAQLPHHDRMAWSVGLWTVGAIFVLGYAWFTGRRIRWGRATPAAVLWRWVFGFGLFLGFLLGYLEARRALHHPVGPQPVLQALSQDGAAGGQWWLFALTAVLLAPLVEEVLFRGMIQDALRRAFDPVSAIVLTGIAFGLIHGVHYAPPLALAGMFFGWLREWSGGLWAPILAHVLHNAAVLVMTVALPGLTEWMYRAT